jgi:shikimate dehydrogenase
LTALAGVLGFPVGHSRSPDMMNAAFAELELDWHYVKLPVAPDLFAEIVPALAGSGFRGANVTIPHKVAAHALAGELTEAASAIGAVNTLSFEGGRILGDNTDAGGLVDALDADLSGASVLVLGAGGTARAALWALREAGADVAVWNRTPERAADLAAEFGVRHASEIEPARVLVNATSLGLHGEDLPAELGLDRVEARSSRLGRLRRGWSPELVADVVYGGEPTALCRWGEARGARVVDGLEMLLRQGARSFERWTGREAPLDAMRRALRR